MLDSVSFSVNYGEVVAVVGPSGSGKSTILQMAAALISPDSGMLTIDGKEIFPVSRKPSSITKLRSSIISYVSQDDFLFESLTVFENVSLALELNGSDSHEKRVENVDRVLEMLGVKTLADRQISDVSAGERKRVAIGRSLVTNPKILIADEPTGSLDLEATNEFLSLIKREVDNQKMALLLASHDVLELKGIADEMYTIKDYTLSEVES
ncbi:MAG: ABC transporter ATP-binding protein [Nitrososphaerales archaeon]